MRNISKKVVEKIETNIVYTINVFPKAVTFMR